MVKAMPRNVNIEQYKADQIYQAKLAELQGDRYRAMMHYRAAVDAERMRQDTELAKAKQAKEIEEKKLKQLAANNDLESIIKSRTALDNNARLSENNRIQGYGVLAKLMGDSKMSNAEAEGVWAAIRKQKIKDPVTGKLRELDGKEQNEAFREIKARREMTPYADALGRLLGVGQMQEAAGIPAKDVYGNELGAPVNQPSLAKGQNILNPNPPQDRSVPPQQQARPRQQAYMEGGLPTWLQQAGVPGAQAAEAEARFKQGGIQEVTNPTSTNYNSMVAKLAGIAPPKMTPEMEKRFQEYLAATTGGQYDSQQYLEAKKAFMMNRNNWYSGGNPQNAALMNAYKKQADIQKQFGDNPDLETMLLRGQAIEIDPMTGQPKQKTPDIASQYENILNLVPKPGEGIIDQLTAPHQFVAQKSQGLYDWLSQQASDFWNNNRTHPAAFSEGHTNPQWPPAQAPAPQMNQQQAIDVIRQAQQQAERSRLPQMPQNTGLSVPFIPRAEAEYSYDSGGRWDDDTMANYMRLVQGY